MTPAVTAMLALACVNVIPEPRIVQSDDALWQLKATALAAYVPGTTVAGNELPATIILPSDWDATNPQHRALLAHEMAHHIQAQLKREMTVIEKEAQASAVQVKAMGDGR
ncbi:MAG: hypothetical protein IPI58_09710 [Alphaproteobacteria bacterium]|nr:MAG: hypothetical protein IPI58_09710 [Alphaproteobacteria bacterium]